MAISLPAIVARISLDDRELAEGSRKLGGVGKAIAGGLAVAAAAAGTVAVKGAQAAAEVDKGLREVLTLNSGLKAGSAEAAAALDGLKGGVRELSAEVGIAQNELVGGLYQAISAGVPEDNAFEFLRVASKFAIAGVTDVETAVDGLTTAINAYGLSADDAEAVAASFFTGIQDGKTNAEELSASLFQVAPAAGAAGVSLEETIAALAALTGSGTPTAVATTQVRQAINELADSTGKAGTKFEEVAGKSFREFIAQGGSLEEALQMLQAEAEESGEVIGDYFGSVEASSAATSLATTRADAFGDSLANQAAAGENAAEVLDNAYQLIDESASRSWDRARIAGQNALIEVGEVVAPVAAELAERLVPAIGAAADAFGRTVEYVQKNGPTIVAQVQRIATILGAILLPVLLRVVAQQTRAFVVGAAQAVRAAATHYIASLRVVAGWVLQGAAAVRNLAFAVRYYVTLGVQAAAGAARHVAAGVRIVAGWVAQGVAATASAVRQAAAWTAGVVVASAQAAARFVANVARVVAGWALMGAKALLAAGKVALSWVIAFGPIALVIAAVVGLVVLIVRNWDTIVAATKRFADRVVAFLTGLRDRSVAAVQRMRDRVVGAITTLRDRAIALVRAILTFYINVWATMIRTVVGLVLQLRDRVVGGLTRMRDGVVNAATSARDRVVSAFVGLVAGVTTRIASLVSTVRGIPGRILSALGNVGRLLRSAGQDLIRGLIAGITGFVGRAVTAVRDAVGSVVDGAKRMLGIKSPSTVFAAIGRDTGRGMVVGLESMGGAVQRAAERALIPDVDAIAVGAVAPAASAPAAAGVTAEQVAAIVNGPGRRAAQFDVQVTARDPHEAAAATARELGWLIGGRVG